MSRFAALVLAAPLPACGAQVPPETHVAAESAPTPPVARAWAQPNAALDPARLHALVRGVSLPAGPVAFDPSAARVAVGAGASVRFVTPEGAVIASVELGSDVRDLAFATDGALWALVGGALVRLKGDAVACRAAIDAEWILGATPDGGVLAVTQTWMETGAWGETVGVDRSCALTRGALVHEAPSAQARSAESTWTGTTARVEGGPKRSGPPTVSLLTNGGPVRSWAVLADRPESDRVEALAAGAGHLLVLGAGGAWELWAADGSAILARGSSGAADLVPVPATDLVALGSDLLDLRDGSRTADALPAPAVAVSPDGYTWVLGAEADRALWSGP